MEDRQKRLRSPEQEDAAPRPRKMSRSNSNNTSSRNSSDAIEVSHAGASACPTKQSLANLILRLKPADASIREVLTTRDSRILIFPSSPRDYNTLLINERWNQSEGAVTTKIAPKQHSGKAVVIQGVDEDVQVEDLLELIRSKGMSPSNGNRLKRTSDGSSTKSIKIFIDDEAHIQQLVNEGIILKLIFYRITRYTTPIHVQCFKCQGLNHLSNACPNERRCLRCAGSHHHRECLASPAQYKCVNCNGVHSSNSSNCPKIKDAFAAATINQRPPTNSTRDASAPPQPSSAESVWPALVPTTSQPTTSTTSQLDDNIRSTIATAVTEAVRQEMGGVVSELAKSFGAEFRNGINAMMKEFRDSVNRYENHIFELETVISKQKAKINDLSIHPSSHSGQPEQAESSGIGETKTTLEISESPEEITILLPPTRILLHQGQQMSSLNKIIKDQLKSNQKILERELDEIKDNIKQKYKSLSAPSSKPKAQRKTFPKSALNLWGITAPTSSDEEPDLPRRNRASTKLPPSRLAMNSSAPEEAASRRQLPASPHLPTGPIAPPSTCSAMHGTDPPPIQNV